MEPEPLVSRAQFDAHEQRDEERHAAVTTQLAAIEQRLWVLCGLIVPLLSSLAQWMMS